MRTIHYTITLGAMVLAASLTASAGADMLYDATQLNSAGGVYANTYYSDNPTNSDFVVDDIEVPAGGWTIDTLSVYDGLLLGGDLTATQAYLVLFPKSLGAVDPMNHTTLVSVTQTPETFTDPNSIPSVRTTQRFDASGLNLVLAPGEYWIGLTPILTGSNPFGAWSSHTNHGDQPMQYAVMHQTWFPLAGGGFTNWGPDMMMRIQGTPVPEPTTLALLLLALPLCRRRR